MKTFLQTSTDYTTISNDDSASNLALGKSLINECIHKVLSSQDWNFNKSVKSLTSVASQQDYSTPVNCLKVDYVKITANNLIYMPKQIRSWESWNTLNHSVVASDIPQYWYYNSITQKVSIFPVPSSTAQTIEIGFTKKIRDLSVANYTIGSVGATADGVVFTGSGTTFTAQMVGRALQTSGTNTETDGLWFDISGFTDTTHLTVRQSVPATVTTASYIIAEMIPFLDGFEGIPLYYALMHYFQFREGDKQKASVYERLYLSGTEEMKKRDNQTVDGIFFKEKDVMVQDPNRNPWGITIS